MVKKFIKSCNIGSGGAGKIFYLMAAEMYADHAAHPVDPYRKPFLLQYFTQSFFQVRSFGFQLPINAGTIF